MSELEAVVGLDIGTTKIAVVVGRRNAHGKIEILGVGKAESIGVTRGVVSHITPTVQAIENAVAEAEKQSNISIRVVNVGIAGQHIKSMQHRGSLIRDNGEEEITTAEVESLRESMYRLVMMPGEEIIHVLAQEYFVDNEGGVKYPEGRTGIKLEGNYHIITGQMAAAKNIHKCVTKAGLEVFELTLEPLASSDAVLSEDEKEAGVALIDIGGGTTDVAIFQDGIIRHTAVIPFGGNIITEDIREGCGILKKHAEKLKVKFGSALASENQENEIVVIPGIRGREPKEISVKNLSHIIQARMEEIIEQVFYEIRNSGFHPKLNAGIVITGGGSQLRHLPQLFEYMTGMDARIGYPTEHLANGTEDLASPQYSTGIGLVIRALESFEQSMKDHKNTRTKKHEERSTFFDKILGTVNKTRQWLEDENE